MAAERSLVLVGAGHAHVAVLRHFGRHPVPGLRLTLVTREAQTPYSGMLPGLIAGHYTVAEAHIATEPLARFGGARLRLAEATGLNLAARTVLCRDGPPVPFDLVSLDTGSRPNTAGVPGAAEHAIAVKPIDGFMQHFTALHRRLSGGGVRRVLMVGGGAGGVELILAIAHRFRGELPAVQLALATAADDILPGFPTRFRARFRTILAESGIATRTGAAVVAVDAGGAVLASGERLVADAVLWAAAAAPPSWLAGSGLQLDPLGFVQVDPWLRAASGVFAAGDMVAFGARPLPRSGVYAVRAGPVLAANLHATLTGGRLRRFRPQRRALAIVGTGPAYAVATRNGVVVEGEWVWRLKQALDRRFMTRYTQVGG